MAELLADPRKFDDDGSAYELLQHYFAGLSIETLRPLLRSEDVWVQRAAGFIASELGRQASSLVEDVLPLLCSNDRHVQNYAMEVLTVCCKHDDSEKFAYVVQKLDAEDCGIRLQAMDLVANSDLSQIEAARQFLRLIEPDRHAHQRGLSTLADGEQAGAEAIQSMLDSENPLERRYAAIAAARLRRLFPNLVAAALLSADADIRQFIRARSDE
jgi:hypothetical protein